MEKKERRVIQLPKIDSNSAEEILSYIDEEKRKDQPAILEIILEDTTGDLESALRIIQAIHEAENIDAETKSKGKLGRAGTLVAASGKPGFRSADRGATFELLSGSLYPSDVDATTLREEDELFFEILPKLTGKRKAVFDIITKQKIVNCSGAIKLGIIDSRPQFINKYLQKGTKGDKKAADSSR